MKLLRFINFVYIYKYLKYKQKKATGEYTSGACNGDNAKTGGPAFFISKIVSFFSFLRNENRILLFHTQNSVYVEWMFYRALLLFL